MKKEIDFTRAPGLIRGLLEPVPFVRLDTWQETPFTDKRGTGVDIMVQVQAPEPKTLLIEIKSEGTPRQIREAVYKVKEAQRRLSYRESYAIIVAPAISDQAAEICKSAGVGFADYTGNCFLSFDRIYIEKKSKETPASKKRRLQNIYSAKSSRVLRVMLIEPYRAWKVEELAKAAKVSLGLVSNVLKALGENEWSNDSPQAGFSLTNPEALLLEWSNKYEYRQNEVFSFYSILKMSEIEEALREYSQEKQGKFALTLFSGASRIAPYTRFNQVFAYLDTDILTASKELKLKSVESGPNITLLEPYDEGVFYGTEDYNGIPVVSPIQLYLDLANYKGRGKEAAEHLFSEVIKPQWSQNQTTVNEK